MTKPPIGRKLGQKVKKGKLKASSRRWIERHINDPYVQRAKLEGYRARAAFKLLEIDEKHHILAGARRIIDLGAAPGSWSQIAAKVTDSTDTDPRVAAIDFLEMDPLPGAAPRSMMRRAPARIWCFSSISSSLKAARARYPSSLARCT